MTGSKPVRGDAVVSSAAIAGCLGPGSGFGYRWCPGRMPGLDGLARSGEAVSRT